MSFIKKIKTKVKLFSRARKNLKLFKKAQKDNDLQISKSDIHQIRLNIVGKNNVVKIGKLRSCQGNIEIYISGDNNFIEFGKNCAVSTFLRIHIGQIHKNFGPVKNVHLSVGDHTGFESCTIQTFNSNSEMMIGSHCMISYDVNMYHTDGHPILDFNSGKIINKVEKLKIGSHVWIGRNATILKNTQIADDCIVGWGAVVAGKFQEGNCILAGNPASVVKQGITWDADGSKGYVQNEKEI